MESEESRAFRVSIRPLLYDKEINLHFDFLEDTMNLEVSLGDYPIGKASIIVLN